ncbi:MAG: TetR/AcrR family transcriptional regulator [Fibrella sp.]|nr:TetR/AcrR family transcriptional regulator [Armatimonadota bacterium]
MNLKGNTNSKRGATHDTLLMAAKRVVARDGVARLTLDTVAQEAGVSKGGVLYHFPTKNALVAAMMESDISCWKAEVATCRDAEIAEGVMPEAGRNVRAFVSAAEGACERKEEAFREMFGGEDMSHWFATSPDLRAGMIAAVAGDHALLKRFRDEFATWQAQFEDDGIDPATATLVRLAADGLFFVDMLGLAPPKGALRQQVLAQLLHLASPKKTDNSV